ncbi:hypothetical protein SLEP1_g53755 [Rubroshorea leprosula]|uniref:Uncharacterized protein n=1 Tax=Rubroshorea leprosula TaxID=152421 RepID=A0AAV5MAS2_9ROSI|nr:hypothetical protein SLEP1_g53755 [Rubroshorea leprosula]
MKKSFFLPNFQSFSTWINKISQVLIVGKLQISKLHGGFK